jgi:lysophospholipase L1-like esterase
MVLTAYSGLFADWSDHTAAFRFKGKAYRVTVRPSAIPQGGTDVLLTTDGENPLVLNASLPGENLFPLVTIAPAGDRFLVSWFQYQRDNVQLCLYDSASGLNRLLPLQGFKSASPLDVIFYDGLPYLLIFKGNNSDNADIFYYHLENGRVQNITASPDSEQEWSIHDEENRVFIETATLYHHYRHRIKKRNLKIKRTKMVEIEKDIPKPAAGWDFLDRNEVAGFGDSITWGTIRMNIDDSEDYYHPEWAYLAQLEAIIARDYNPITTINLGVPGDYTLSGVARLDNGVFTDVKAFYCLIMFGTNDVGRKAFDVDGSIKNLDYIVRHTREIYRLFVIISTIPPQKHHTPGVQYYVDNTEALNAHIIELATRHGIPYIDTYSAFLNSEHYWEDLLETYRGNHPSPLGHEVIARLLEDKIVEQAPEIPGDIEITSQNASAARIQWKENHEFDFSHFLVRFGHSPDNLYKSMITSNPRFTFVRSPMEGQLRRTMYFRIQAVDMDGNGSDFSPIQTIEFE